jgi:hypothetical protein
MKIMERDLECLKVILSLVTYSLKMEAARSSKMLASYHITAQCHNIEDCDVNPHYCENLK